MKKEGFALSAFGMRMREHRQSKNVTLLELASHVGREPFEIAEMETGARPVTTEFIQRSSDYLKLDIAAQSELIKLSSGRRNTEALFFFRIRKALHKRADRALHTMHEWRPSMIRRIGEYVGHGWRQA